MVLWAEGQGEGWCIGRGEEGLEHRGRKHNHRSCKTTAIHSNPTASALHILVTHNFTTDSPFGIKLSKFSLCYLEVSFLWEICAKSA